MVKTFSCGDVVPGCQARFVCSSDDEILVAVASHAADVHGFTEMPEGLVAQVRERITVTV
jgi:predicted small metal-binding protein